MKVVVIDPAEAVRTRVVLCLRESGIEVIGTAGSVGELETLFTSLQPDVVVSEVLVGLHRGVALLELLRSLVPGAKLVIFTNETHFRGPCMAGGADGFFDKSTELDKLLTSLQPR